MIYGALCPGLSAVFVHTFYKMNLCDDDVFCIVYLNTLFAPPINCFYLNYSFLHISYDSIP